ncbi:hypothetical protein PoB_000160500, partial [Plakobranchus ocellatus]
MQDLMKMHEIVRKFSLLFGRLAKVDIIATLDIDVTSQPSSNELVARYLQYFFSCADNQTLSLLTWIKPLLLFEESAALNIACKMASSCRVYIPVICMLLCIAVCILDACRDRYREVPSYK